MQNSSFTIYIYLRKKKKEIIFFSFCRMPVAISLNECHCLLHFTVFVQNFFLLFSFSFSLSFIVCVYMRYCYCFNFPWIAGNTWRHRMICTLTPICTQFCILSGHVFKQDQLHNSISFTYTFFFIFSVYALFQPSYFFWALLHTIILISQWEEKNMSISALYIFAPWKSVEYGVIGIVWLVNLQFSSVFLRKAH